MNLREMTTAELRDWLAEKAGYERSHKGWHKKGVGYVQDPMPPTLDGADAAFPDGWCWERHNGSWWARPIQQKPATLSQYRTVDWPVRVDDTGNEIHDRFLLAALAVEAIEAQTKGNG